LTRLNRACAAIVLSAALVMASALPAGAAAAPRQPLTQPSRMSAGVYFERAQTVSPVLQRKLRRNPLRASIASGTDTGTITITGGLAPFTVALVMESGAEEIVYTGTSRTAEVPLLPGKTDFRVTDTYGGGFSASALGDVVFWVTDNTSRSVQKFEAAANTVTVDVTVRGAETTAAVKLANVSVRPSDDHVFLVFSDEVSGTENNRLIELAPDGSFVGTIAVPGCYKIQDATFDGNDNIYVLDRGFGSGAGNRVNIVKLNRTGSVVATMATTLPSSGISYPMANLTNMIEYHSGMKRLVARINSATFAIVAPNNMTIDSYRYSGDYAYTCMALDLTAGSLYTGGAGFNRPAFFGLQPNFLSSQIYEDASVLTSPTPHTWSVEPALPVITDIAVDSTRYVYTIQRDMAAAITRAYCYNPGADPSLGPAKTVDLPYGNKISVVR